MIYTFTSSKQKKDAIRHPLTLAYILGNLTGRFAIMHLGTFLEEEAEEFDKKSLIKKLKLQ
jgi:hypothetical protein